MALITAQTARSMAAKSHAARRQRASECNLATIPIPQLPAQAAPQADTYLSNRLIRVRAQVEMLDSLIQQENDAARLDRLASALSKLSEIERVLAGRPLPGSHRPMRASAGRVRGIVAVMPE